MKDNKVQKQIEAILNKNFVPFKLQDVLLIIAITDQFNRAGYKLTDVEVTEFLMNKKNMVLINKNGLTNTIEAMRNMRLGTIKVESKPGRNDVCSCGSGKKFKKCCINKRK